MKSSNHNLHSHPQRLAAAGVLLALVIATTGCEQATSQAMPEAAQQVKAARVAPATALPAPPPMEVAARENPDLGGAIKEGMSYTEVRESMKAHGWAPVSDDSCPLNLVGRADYKEFCAANADNESCGYCSDLQGLVQCSADGFCLFVFEHASDRKRLEIGMYGELENWRYNAPDTMFSVSGWRYQLKKGD